MTRLLRFTLLLSLLSTACATTQTSPIVVSSVSVRLVGETYLAIAPVFYRNCNPSLPTYQHLLSERECQEWHDFAIPFRAGFDIAVTALEEAERANDRVKQGQAIMIITDLLSRLSVFEAKVAAMKAALAGKDGG